MSFATELKHDGLDRCDSCGSLVYSESNICPACGYQIVQNKVYWTVGATLMEMERAIDHFIMDLRTMAFYTDFLFTAESKHFRYSLMREPA